MPELFDRAAPEKITFPGVYDNVTRAASAPPVVAAAAVVAPKTTAKAKAKAPAAEAPVTGRKSLKLGKPKG